MNKGVEPTADGVALSGVSETALLTLNGRAYQAKHPHAIINDEMAIALVDAIDFDFDKFGRTGQEMALRSLAVDRCVAAYLRDHPKATVVALAEGLQTTFWRLDSVLPDGQFTWVSVDLPPVIALRERLLPPSDRIKNVSQSALDYTWMDRINDVDGVIITAEGLLMYLQPDEALGLIAHCARRFPGGQMFFDLPPTVVTRARRGLRSSRRYRLPPMPFSLSLKQLTEFARTVPEIAAVHDIAMPKGRGWFFGHVFPALWRFPLTKQLRGVYAVLDFGSPG